VNTELANQIRDRIRQTPQLIQVNCPRDHYINRAASKETDRAPQPQ
jgi:hypothetical protein